MIVQEKTIDVITVTKDDETNLEITYHSISLISQKMIIPLTWIVIDSGEKLQNSLLHQSISSDPRITFKYFYKPTFGIYQAMNFGLSKTSSDYFILINSGDILLKNLRDQIPSFSNNQVSCFQSEWHNNKLQRLDYRNNYKIFPKLGRMPNHQAMIFPNVFRNFLYNEKFKISSDQDLKIRLAKEGNLILRHEAIVSSLFGGISTRQMTRTEAINRSIETFLIFKNNYNLVWALSISLVYSLRFFSRTIIQKKSLLRKII